MKGYFVLFFLTIALLFTSNALIAQQLIFQWETDSVFKIPESTLFFSTKNLIYVSNIDGKSSGKDSTGFISTLYTTGEIKQLHWVDGLNAPKGMSIVKNKLFVSDINQVAIFNIETGTLEKNYLAPAAKFLNDVCSDGKGNVFISDMLDKTIYKIENGVLAKWLVDDAFENINGLYYYDGDLYVGTKNAILKINATQKTIVIWASNTGSIDGLEWDGRQGFIFSDWQGHIYHVKQGLKPVLLLDTTDKKMNAADIGYNIKDQMLYVPTFLNNRVVAYKFSFE